MNPHFYRVRQIALKWYIVILDEKMNVIDDQTKGPFNKIQEANQEAIATGLLDLDKHGNV